jgi:hypothetical protein
MATPKLRQPGRSRFCHMRRIADPAAGCGLGIALVGAGITRYTGTRVESTISPRIASACSDFFWVET